MKLNETVRREVIYISVWVAIMSAVMEAIFLIIGKWDYTVLLGNLLSAFAAILNFLLMGISVQIAVSKDEKGARNVVKLSQSLRNLMLFAFAALGVLLPCFNTWSSIIPLLFPSIAVLLRKLLNKKQ